MELKSPWLKNILSGIMSMKLRKMLKTNHCDFWIKSFEIEDVPDSKNARVKCSVMIDLNKEDLGKFIFEEVMK